MKRSKYTDEQILAIVKEGERAARSPICAGATASPSRRTTAGNRSMAAWSCRLHHSTRSLRSLVRGRPRMGPARNFFY